MFRSRTALALAAALGTLTLSAGCARDYDTLPSEERDIGFDVRASDNDIMAGETVTLTANTRNTLNRDAAVRWNSTGGRIRTEDNGRIARVTFDEPGSYTVTGKLLLDGRVSREDTVDVKVKPVR